MLTQMRCKKNTWKESVLRQFSLPLNFCCLNLASFSKNLYTTRLFSVGCLSTSSDFLDSQCVGGPVWAFLSCLLGVYLSEWPVWKTESRLLQSPFPCLLGHILISHQLRGPFPYRDWEGWVPASGLSRSPLQEQTGQLPPCSTRSLELLAVKGRAGLAAVLSPCLSHPHTHCTLSQGLRPVDWYLPSASGGVCPTLSTGDLGLRIEGHMACPTAQPLLRQMFAKQDVPLFPDGSDSQNTCPTWGGGLPCRLGLLVNKSLGMAGGRRSTPWREWLSEKHLSSLEGVVVVLVTL